MSDVYVLAGARTPIGKFLGAVSRVPATELGAIVVRESLRRAGVEPRDVDEVILGMVLPAGVGQAPARQAALKAGLPSTVPALTINKMQYPLPGEGTTLEICDLIRSELGVA